MKPVSLAINLEDQAATLRRQAAGIRKSGRPVDVPFGSGRKVLHMLNAKHLEDDAADMERDAVKLRGAYR